ncbi:MAG: hypothetical protein ACYDEQ_09100 [Desulfocucumaceae bacterium]
MKKILLASLVVAMCAGMAMAQPADVNSALVPVTVPVGGVFSMTLSAAAITYLALLPGDFDNSQIMDITVRSNWKNYTWILKVQQDGLLTDAAIVENIPSVNFTHTSTGGAGIHADVAATEFVTGAATTFYTCALAEQKNVGTPTVIQQQYQLSAPASQAAGTYTNNLTYTLTVTP